MARDVVRVQARSKAIYRSRGIPTQDKRIYHPKGREAWLEKLPPAGRWPTERLPEVYDRLSDLKQATEQELVRVAQTSDLQGSDHRTGHGPDPGGSVAGDRRDPSTDTEAHRGDFVLRLKGNAAHRGQKLEHVSHDRGGRRDGIARKEVALRAHGAPRDRFVSVNEFESQRNPPSIVE